jgi:hypothetical protein
MLAKELFQFGTSQILGEGKVTSLYIAEYRPRNTKSAVRCAKSFIVPTYLFWPRASRHVRANVQHQAQRSACDTCTCTPTIRLL